MTGIVLMILLSAALITGCSELGIGGDSGGEQGEHVSESGGEGGSEGGSEAGGEGAEGGSEAGLETLMSSPVTPITQPWSGNLGGLDVAGSYDPNAMSFTTVVTNTLSEKLCYVYTEPHLKMGANTVGEMGPGLVGDLEPGQTKTSVLYLADEPALAGITFDGYKMHMEVYSCSGPGLEGGAPTINPLTGLPSSAEGGSEGGTEGAEGNEGGGATALMPNETYDVLNNGARLILRYDAASNTFIGTVENTTNALLTRARIEIHLSNGTELGPTTPTDLAPGEVLDIVLPATAQSFDTWSPHAEVGASEGGESGSEAGGEHGEGGEGGGS